jgi:uncharacterized protein involved in exopolysaccharide biosynthesis
MSSETHDEGPQGLPDFLRDPVGLVRRRWPWMALVAVLGALGSAAAVTVLLPTAYVAVATVLVNSQQLPEDFVRTTVQGDEIEGINAMVGAVVARDRLTELVEEHDLYPRLRESAPMIDVVSGFRENLTVEQQEALGQTPSQMRSQTARLYTVSFRYDQPARAAEVANEIASALTVESIRMRQEKARLATEFLRKQLHDIEAQLHEAERAVAEFKEDHRGELPDELEANLRKLERLQSQRQSLALQIADAETRIAMLAATPQSGVDLSPEARLADLRARYAEALATSTEEHPNVVSLKRQVEELEKQIADGSAATSRTGLAASADRTIAELRRQQVETEAEIAALDQQVARTPSRQQALTALQQRVDVLRENHAEFLNKVQDAELAENLEAAQQGEHVSVLDRAVPPSTPERSRLKYFAAGLVAALGLAALAGLLLELRDPVVIGAEQIEERFALPVLGSVPRIG